MKNFTQTFLASLLAIVVASMALGFLNMIIMAFVIGNSLNLDKSTSFVEVKDSTVLCIDMKTIFEEGAVKNKLDMGGISFDIDDLYPSGVDKVNYLKSLDVIRYAANDDKIIAIHLNPNGLSMNLSQILEFRDALSIFAEKKPIYVYTETFQSLGAYYLSSVSDSIMIGRLGDIPWVGLSSSEVFLKGLFDKLGIETEVFRCGKFKSAVEPYTEKKMSPESRKQVELMLNTTWGYIVRDIAKSRGIDSTELQRLASELSIATAQDALNHKFVDRIGNADQAQQMIYDIYGGDKKKMKSISLKNYMSVLGPASKVKDKIAIIYAEGNIMPDGTRARMGKVITPKEIISKLRKVEKDSTVKAVVIRVNSPGGSALDSEIICAQVEKLRKVKPVIISMSDYAASGGYYIAALADRIVSTPLTLTGSIGVFSVGLNLQEAMNKHLGITFDNVKTNKSADFEGKMTPAQHNYIQKSVDNVYLLFKERVASGRNMTLEQVEEIASGRVWTGIDAKRVGLVDELGGLTKAISLASKISGVEKYSIYEVENYSDSMGGVLDMLKKYIKTEVSYPDRLLDEGIDRIKSVMNMSGKVLAISPVVLNFE